MRDDMFKANEKPVHVNGSNRHAFDVAPRRCTFEGKNMFSARNHISTYPVQPGEIRKPQTNIK